MKNNYSKAESKVRHSIAQLIEQAAGKKFSSVETMAEYPPDNVGADFSVPCFLLAKVVRKAPIEVSKMLAEKISKSLGGTKQLISTVQAAGPYLNFTLNRQKFSQLVLSEVSQAKQDYGRSTIGKGKKIMVEYYSPNTNKPLTIGHLRNLALGNSLTKLSEFLGYKVLQSTIYNDHNIAIAKTIAGYLRWGKGQTPKQANLKPDHFVGDFYVRFNKELKNNPDLETVAKNILFSWERGDRKVISVWKKLIGWITQGYDQTLKKIGDIKFEYPYYESDIYKEGKEIVNQGLKKKIFEQGDDGVVIAPLEKMGLPDKVVLRSDGTSVYVTQDLHLAQLRSKHKLQRSIYVVASEQDMYFKQLFAILGLLKIGGKEQLYHLSYGMIRLPDGRIKSREGLVKGTAADDVINQLEALARQEISQRSPELKQKELDKRSSQIAIGALLYYILQVDPKTTMIFDPQRSIAFVGHTGPYVQYMNARISSILGKTKTKPASQAKVTALQDAEYDLVKLLARFPTVISKSANNYAPSIMAEYLYVLARSFSVFYEKVPVLKAEKELQQQRLLLLVNVQYVLQIGLGLLGIEAPEKM